MIHAKVWKNTEVKLRPYIIPRGVLYDKKYDECGRWYWTACENAENAASRATKLKLQICDAHNKGLAYRTPAAETYMIEEYFGDPPKGKLSTVWLVCCIPEEIYAKLTEPEYNEYGEISP